MSELALWFGGLLFLGLAFMISSGYKAIFGKDTLVRMTGTFARVFFVGFTVLFALIFIVAVF